MRLMQRLRWEEVGGRVGSRQQYRNLASFPRSCVVTGYPAVGYVEWSEAYRAQGTKDFRLRASGLPWRPEARGLRSEAVDTGKPVRLVELDIPYGLGCQLLHTIASLSPLIF
ncbi:hypothetical protein HG15A2_13010 [Adhaeretor mobilis]|uniref:Uncharacterized protein n=1 Tax=Adhaeretor mobilis TaxID=1930276 RepID=A0A517MT20_9BACT|nr:hypothetical protein HG15A2_13010 [Adhaeretor mobilis]